MVLKQFAKNLRKSLTTGSSKKTNGSSSRPKSKSKRCSLGFNSSSDSSEGEFNDNFQENTIIRKSSSSSSIASNKSSASSRREGLKNVKKEGGGSGRLRQSTKDTHLVNDDDFFIEGGNDIELQKRSNSDNDLVSLAATPQTQDTSSSSMKKRNSSSTIDLTSLSQQVASISHKARLPRRSSMKKLSSFDSESSEQLLEDGSSNTKNRPKRRMSVGFSSCPVENSIVDTLHHNDMTDEEKQNVWMQQECMTKIQQNCLRVVKTAETFGDDNLCTRGLEQYLSKHAHHREGQIDAIEEVLVEQEIQSQFGIVCADSIAAAYKSVGKSEDSHNRAHLRAIQDQEEAKKYLMNLQDDVLEKVHNPEEAKQYLLSLSTTARS